MSSPDRPERARGFRDARCDWTERVRRRPEAGCGGNLKRADNASEIGRKDLLLFDWIIRHGLWHHVGRWDGGSISRPPILVGQSKTVRGPWAPRPLCRSVENISSGGGDIYLTLLSPDRLIWPQDYGIMGAVGGAAPPGNLPKRKKTSRPIGREVYGSSPRLLGLLI